MDALYIRLPSDRIGVPTDDFAAVLRAVAARWQADKSDRFAAGALSCAQWIAGITDAHPLREEREPCTVQAMQSCQMAADAVIYGMAWAPANVDKRWALGVGGMVAWARGASRQPPVPLPGAPRAA